VGDSGAKALIKALKTNWSLTKLILHVSAKGNYGRPQALPQSYQISSRVNLVFYDKDDDNDYELESRNDYWVYDWMSL
ncbi:hypothetical protein BGZ83_000790, partial [Gryganskiella cystojenkinii]